jgi:hypothetical protein
MLHSGKLYFTGLNSGDYEAFKPEKDRVEKGDYIDLSFRNVNRTPSFLLIRAAVFTLIRQKTSTKKILR